jgi:hypothetical protein
MHLVSIDKETNRVVEQAAIGGPGGAAVANGTLWVSNDRSSSGSLGLTERIGTLRR